ncbi:uncharacterized protein LOC110025224 [Phalaenopsis equestris]|uniref:uncharacterized protein LOC110025224 n=1 Tax=Phalaenopsis equestris TaxID=78828 RepID=UPI0009E5E3EB|nr:uncharacterized protein LOC110025224 [Phalaenopsis equestris]
MDGRHLLIQLVVEEDYDRLFVKQSVIIDGATMKIVKWTPDFDPSKEPPVVPLWYKLSGLPLPFFKLNALFNIGRALGTPLKVDAPTDNKARPALARIQVERDITLPELKQIWIGSDTEGFWQDIVPEQKPYYCQHCKMFGHTVEKCYRLHLPPKRNTGRARRETGNTSLKVIGNIAKETHLNNRKETTQRTEGSLPTIIVNSSSADPLGELSDSPPNRITVNSSIKTVRKEINEIIMITPSPPLQEESQTDTHGKAPKEHVITGLKQAIEEDWQVQTAKRKSKQVTEVQKLQQGVSLMQAESKTRIKFGSPNHHRGCTKDDRKVLWNCLLNISQQMDSPWIVGGDFNCITSFAEKTGGRAPSQAKMNTFNDNIHSGGLFDLGFKGPAFTWKRRKIWERLDKVLVNDSWKWSWGAFGNVLTKVQELEEEVIRLEQDEHEGIVEEKELLTVQNKLLTVIDYHDQILKQKAAMNIFTEGDRNTKFYHAYIKYKRKCNTIHAIENTEGKWLHENVEIANDVVCYFKNLLNQEHNHIIPIDPNYFSAELNYTTNLKLTEIRDEEEIWEAMNSIDINKATGPHRFTAEFYKKSWDIIKPEVIAVVANFFPRKQSPTLL